jgi:hypothetical protein
MISIDDLREGLLSMDIYDGKDKHSFECLVVQLLKMNKNGL